MKGKVAPFLENISEATTACLFTMVQGNILAITVQHWLIASQIGVVAGALTAGVLLLWRDSRPWLVAAVLGLATGVVDYFVHTGELGSIVVEAIVTGLGAAALSFVVGVTVTWTRGRVTRHRFENRP